MTDWDRQNNKENSEIAKIRDHEVESLKEKAKDASFMQDDMQAFVFNGLLDNASRADEDFFAQ